MGIGGAYSTGPTPWWQLPGKQGSLDNLQKSAPAGYEYDPVKMEYTRTPTSAGQRTAEYSSAATNGTIPSLQGLMGAFGTDSGEGGGGSTAAFGGTGGSGGGAIDGGGMVMGPQAPDNTEANSAIFARAKEATGRQARASLDSLAGELGGQNMLGSGAQVQGTRDIIQDASGRQGDVIRENAIQDSQQSADFKKLGYEGAITQRGQNINAQEANARISIAQQQAKYQQLSLILNALGGMNKQATTFPDLY